MDYLQMFYGTHKEVTRYKSEVFTKFIDESTYPIYDTAYFASFETFSMIDISDNLHLINVEDLIVKMAKEYLTNTDDISGRGTMSPNPCFPTFQESDSQETRNKYFGQCKKTIRSIKNLDVHKEFFIPTSEIKQHDKEHWNYLKHIKEIVIWTDLTLGDSMKEISYKDFDSQAKKICSHIDF
jgi:hypothetical protein